MNRAGQRSAALNKRSGPRKLYAPVNHSRKYNIIFVISAGKFSPETSLNPLLCLFTGTKIDGFGSRQMI